MASARKHFPPRRYSTACARTKTTSIVGTRITQHLCSLKGTLVVEERREGAASKDFVDSHISINESRDFVDGFPDFHELDEICRGGTSPSKKVPRKFDEESRATRANEIASAEVSRTGRLKCMQSFPIFPCIEDKILPRCIYEEESVNGHEVVVKHASNHWAWTAHQVQDFESVEARLGGGQGLLVWHVNDCVVFGFRSSGSRIYYVSAFHHDTGGLMLISGAPHPYAVSEHSMAFDRRFFREVHDRNIGGEHQAGVILKPEFNHKLHVSVVDNLVTIVRTEGVNYTLWSIE